MNENCNVTNNVDCELKALAKAFAEEAVKKGYSLTETNNLLRDKYYEVKYSKETYIGQESLKEAEFRKKAIKFLESNPEALPEHYNKICEFVHGRIVRETNPTLEMICTANKIFENFEHEQPIKRDDWIGLTKSNLLLICSSLSYEEIKDAYDKLMQYFKTRALSKEAWEKLCEFKKQYKYRKKSPSELILEIVWLVNNPQ